MYVENLRQLHELLVELRLCDKGTSSVAARPAPAYDHHERAPDDNRQEHVWTKDDVKAHLLKLQRRVDTEYKQHLQKIEQVDRMVILKMRMEVFEQTRDFNSKYREKAGSEIIDTDEVLALFKVYEELLTLLIQTVASIETQILLAQL
jgi:hypothetical protein